MRARSFLAKPPVLPASFLAVFLVAVMGGGAARADSEADGLPAEAARAAVERSLPFLEKDGDGWMRGKISVQEGSACVSCHHVGYAVWSHNEAARAGIEVPRERIDDLAARALDFVGNAEKGRPASWGPLMLGESPHKAFDWRSIHGHLAGQQEKNGTWRARGQFPNQRRPIEETDAVVTLWTLLALAATEPLAVEPAGGRAKALAWLEGAERGTTTEWLAARAAVAHALGEAVEADALLEQLRGQQNGDGGWGWRAREPSNAFSTGQALYTLGVTGEPGADAVAQAQRYLARTQEEDGTWLVPSRLTSKETSEDRDYIYHYWGTAWAAIGLSRSLPPAAEGEGARTSMLEFGRFSNTDLPMEPSPWSRESSRRHCVYGP